MLGPGPGENSELVGGDGRILSTLGATGLSGRTPIDKHAASAGSSRRW